MVGISGEVVAIARKRVVGRKAPGWLKVEIKNFIGGKGTVVDAHVVEFALPELVASVTCVRRSVGPRFPANDEGIVVLIADCSRSGDVVHRHSVKIEELFSSRLVIGSYNVMPPGGQVCNGVRPLLVTASDPELEADRVLVAPEVVAPAVCLGEQQPRNPVAETLPVRAVRPEADRDCRCWGKCGVWATLM